MSDKDVTAISGIPTAAFFLLLGVIITLPLPYFLGILSPFVVIIFAGLLYAFWSLFTTIRAWRACDPATRPALKFPVKPVFWTLLILGTLVVVIKEIGDEISNAYRF